ncbi:hypothetical protein ACLKA7_008802 [Drosophila subpalustris]
MSSSSSITRPSWKDWVERNAKPKLRYINPNKAHSQPTRWQKAGPMTRDQWVNFYKWLEEKGETNHQNSQTKPKFKTRPEEGRRQLIPGVFFCVENHKREKREKQRQLQAKLEALSVPRVTREKFVAPPARIFTYRPQLSYRDPPRLEVGRPSKKPPVPCCFQHDDLEAEFWANIRFPISKRALRAKPTQKLIELAKPRVYPPKPHCPIPQNMDDQPRKRTKMTAKQWQQHLARLKYLSRPNPRVLAELALCDCGVCHFCGSYCEYCGCRRNSPLF